MTNTPVIFRQKDVERALRAAMTFGAGMFRVRITKAGDILIEHVEPGAADATPRKAVAARGEIKL